MDRPLLICGCGSTWWVERTEAQATLASYIGARYVLGREEPDKASRSVIIETSRRVLVCAACGAYAADAAGVGRPE